MLQIGASKNIKFITISQKNLWLWAVEILFFCLTLKMYSGIRLVHFEHSEFWELLKKNLTSQNVCTIYSQYILSIDRLSTLKRSDAQNVAQIPLEFFSGQCAQLVCTYFNFLAHGVPVCVSSLSRLSLARKPQELGSPLHYCTCTQQQHTLQK